MSRLRVGTFLIAELVEKESHEEFLGETVPIGYEVVIELYP
jgi:hypothetical protein